MFTGLLSAFCLLAFDAPPAVVLDRIAVVVGKRAIKASDVDFDLRVTAFLNRVPLALTADARKKAAERLIDQQLIRLEIVSGEFPRASDSDAAALLQQIRTTRFGSSDIRMRAELSRYVLSEDRLQAQLLWQLTVLRFINERFRPGVLVTDDEVRKYYDDHLAELKRQYPADSSFETLAPKIRESLEGEQTNKQFEAWLGEARKQAQIRYHEEALK